MLVDRATIFVRSGRGGDGSGSMRREKFIPKGGPDGGDGGDGGDVVLIGDPAIDTLVTFSYQPHYRAGHGEHGMSKQMFGSRGEDCVVPVPLGTLVYSHETGDLLADISEPGQRYVAARGGRGGLGNVHFKTSTNQAPREGTPGGLYEEKTLRLELKLLADIGLVGLPNAGKSTLLRAVSRAMPKVADYPFTTLSPVLGIAELSGERRLVVADLPGLIEGAAQGAGLGHDFLRHIERTRAIVHVLDIMPTDGSTPRENYLAIRRELAEYSEVLAEKREVVALNKIDLVPEEERESMIRDVRTSISREVDGPMVVISGAARQGIEALLEACWEAAEKGERPQWAPAR